MRFTFSTPRCDRKGQESNDSKYSANARYGSGFLVGLLTGFFCWSSMMAIFLAFTPFFGTSFSSANTIQEQQVSQGPEQRPVGELRKDLKAFVKNSKSDDVDTQVGAVLDLCRLHFELVNDPRYDKYFQLQGFRAVASKRLKTFVKEVELKKKRLAREDKKAKRAEEKEAAANGKSGLADNSSGDSSSKDGLIDSDGNPYSNGSNGSDGSSDSLDARYVSDAMSNSMYSMSQFTGGPVHMFGYLPGNFAPPWHDQDLINLIQTTINPDHWKANGGEADMFWYDPAKALVITGSSEMHDRVTDLLNQLRFLSR